MNPYDSLIIENVKLEVVNYFKSKPSRKRRSRANFVFIRDEVYSFFRRANSLKKKQLLVMSIYFQNFVRRTWEYFGSSIASRLHSKSLVL